MFRYADPPVVLRSSLPPPLYQTPEIGSMSVGGTAMQPWGISFQVENRYSTSRRLSEIRRKNGSGYLL